jgi:thiol-disulfide isomerase/thioredoxin
MKKIFTFLVVIFLFSNSAQAQLSDGSIAPDFTATDLNGVEHNLFDLLNQEKTVILDVSATWCPPCWSYHNSGVLEDIWEQYGPDGTDEIFIFHIEGDGGTTVADLYGTGTNTLGDWVEGTHYPIINSSQIANSYQISYFPTLYSICPDRTVIEIGQANLAAHVAAANNCLQPTGDTNAGVEIITLPSGFCPGETTIVPKVRIGNGGYDNLTSAEITYTINGTASQMYSYSGDLATFAKTVITLDPITFMAGEMNTIEASISMPNGVVDEESSDNISTLERNTPSTTNNLTITLNTDCWGEQVLYQIKTLDGEIIVQNGGFDDETEYIETVSLGGNTCYEVILVDISGNGMNGSQDPDCGVDGSFVITDDLGNVAFSYDGSTEYSQLKSVFVTSQATSVNELEDVSNIVLSPNPTSNKVNVSFSLAAAIDMDITVYNVIGQKMEVLNQNFSAGLNQFSIDASEFANGVYFVNFSSEEGVETANFVVKK